MATDPEQSKGDTPSPLPTESTSTLTREGSLTPQWMQPKSGSGGTAFSGAPHSTRSRLGNDADRQTDASMRRRSESLGGNEALLSKARDHERVRPPKWTPDDRETWKPKERWANGPDNSKRWLDVPTTGRQKQGWGTGDVLSRSHGDRWNTEGGRWTEERRQPEEKDYVPKNARWNDEERAERWRSSTSGRNDVVGRGRGQNPRGPGGNRRMISDAHVTSDLNGVHAGDSGSRVKQTEDGRVRYSKKELHDICHSLQEKMGPALMLPRGVDTSYPYLFKSDVKMPSAEASPREQKEVVPQTPPPPAAPPMPEIDGIGPDELEADSWVYKDPNGQVQGPFSKQEVLAWWEEGYFPPNLPVQSQLSAKENWVPLEKLLKLWGVSVENGTSAAEDPPREAAPPPRKLEGCDSLVTVGSHISTTLLSDMNADNVEETPSSQPVTEAPSGFPSYSSQPPPQVQPQQMQQAQIQTAPSQFQNPVSDLQQTMQNLLLQRQKQSQQAAAAAGVNVSGLDFSNPSLGSTGLSGLRPGVSFPQNNPFIGAYGLQQQQQQRPAGLQNNAFLTPSVLEALQQRVNAQQQTLNRPQMPSPYGFDMNSGLRNQLHNQMQGQVNLAALLNQNQMAQGGNEQRTATPSDLQRLLQAKMLQQAQQAQQAQGNSYGGLNNPLSAGAFGGNIRAPFMQQPQQQAQWGNHMPSAYGALNSLLQQRSQQMNPQQQHLAQAMLLNKLQGMHFPNQQLGMNRPPVPSREHLLSLAQLQGSAGGGDESMVDVLVQQRQRNNMSPPNNAFQTQLDNNFALMGQSTAPPSLPPFNYPNPKQMPFPQHILQQLTGRSEGNPTTMPEAIKGPNPPMLSLDAVTKPDPSSEAPPPKLSPASDQRSKMNAWGVNPAPTSTTSLLEIQEQESKSAQQQSIVSKEKPAPSLAIGPVSGGGWNVQPMKPTPLVDIMQEDKSKKQAEAAAQSKPPANPTQSAKQGTAWTKKAGRNGAQAVAGDESGKGDSLTFKEEKESGGFWNLASTEVTTDSCDLDFSHDASESEVQLFSGQLKISQQFREWCKMNMVAFGGSGDVALIEFLLSLKSRSEIADYIQEYFKEAPPDKLSVFISEFLKRKDADSSQIKKERGNQKTRKKTSKSKDPSKTISNAVELDTVSSGTSESHGLDAPGSGKGTSMTTTTTTTTTTRARENKSKPKVKKQAKGQQIPADMLGFKSNVNSGTVYRGNPNG